MFIESEQLEPNKLEWLDLITWYQDDTLEIEMSNWPSIITQDCNKYSQSEKDFKTAKRWPYLLTEDLIVCITDFTTPDYSKCPKAGRDGTLVINYSNLVYTQYAFKINARYAYDGATINRLLWRLIGPPGDQRFLVGALLHDVLCQHHEYIDDDRELASMILERCLRCTGTDWFTRTAMYWSVDVYQNLFRGW